MGGRGPAGAARVERGRAAAGWCRPRSQTRSNTAVRRSGTQLCSVVTARAPRRRARVPRVEWAIEASHPSMAWRAGAQPRAKPPRSPRVEPSRFRHRRRASCHGCCAMWLARADRLTLAARSAASLCREKATQPLLCTERAQLRGPPLPSRHRTAASRSERRGVGGVVQRPHMQPRPGWPCDEEADRSSGQCNGGLEKVMHQINAPKRPCEAALT